MMQLVTRCVKLIYWDGQALYFIGYSFGNVNCTITFTVCFVIALFGCMFSVISMQCRIAIYQHFCELKYYNHKYFDVLFLNVI